MLLLKNKSFQIYVAFLKIIDDFENVKPRKESMSLMLSFFMLWNYVWTVLQYFRAQPTVALATTLQ